MLRGRRNACGGILACVGALRRGVGEHAPATRVVRRRAPAALLGALTVTLLVVAPAGAVTSAQIVQTVNAERSANGLPPVREDPALSAGCAQYDEYRRMNGSLEDAFTLHGEEPGKPGYSAAGAKAARDSLLNAGDLVTDSFDAGDVFDDAPNHLVALMDPAVALVGADQTDFELGIFGTVHLVCIDVRSAPSRPKPRRLRVYVYRGPNGRVPAVHHAYREGPRGLGSLVAVYFAAPAHTTVRLRSLTVRDVAGKTQPLLDLAAADGLVYAPTRARRALSKGAAKSPTPTATGRVPGTREETPAERERRQQEAERAGKEALESVTREVEKGLKLRYEAEALGHQIPPMKLLGTESLGR
jgi:hypothetical protein